MSYGLTRQQKRHMRQLRNDLEKVLADPAGRRVLIWIMGTTDVNSISFDGRETTFYREGRRSIGVDLIRELNAVNPMAYADLLRESVKLAQNEQLEAQNDHDDA